MAIIVKDSFNRANNTTTLGNTETGQPWKIDGVQIWGINNNRAYSITADWNYAVYVDAGISNNIAIEVTVPVSAGQSQIIWRYKDTNNNFTYQDGILYEVLNGSDNRVGYLPELKSGDIFTVELINNRHIIYINKVKVAEYESPNLINETKFGFGTNNTTSAKLVRFDDFLIRTLNNTVESDDILLSTDSSFSVAINKTIYGNLDISGNTNYTILGSKLFNNSASINSSSELNAIPSKVLNNPINLNSNSDIEILAQKVMETESVLISNDSNLSFEGKKTINNEPISLSGNPELSLQPNIARSGIVSLSSSSMLDVESNSGVLIESVSLISDSFASIDASRLLNTSTSLDAESYFSVESNNRIHMDDLVLSSDSSLECISIKITDVLIKLLSEGSFVANTISTANGEVSFSASGDMYVESIKLSKDISVDLTGSSNLSFAGSLINGVVIGLENESFVNIESNRLINNGLSFDSTTNLLLSGLKTLSDSVDFQSDNLLTVTGSIKVEGDIYLSNESELVLTLIDIYIKIIETDVTLKTRMISELSIVKTADSIFKVVQTMDSELETIQTVDSTFKVVRSLDATSKL